ncbi:MAG: DUF3306 domain-containing protein [Pararhodobacter sp.]|nr:DUF3306 domain-containing protein [Pararhodobacter sp.]
MSGGSFLERWSRRKAENERAGAPSPPAIEATEPLEEDAADTKAPTLSEEDLAALPRIEDLTPHSDLRAFLRPGVPTALKNAAMRKMWLLTPAIRDHSDCAVDYAWDWNTPGGVPGNGGRLTTEGVQKMVKALFDPAPAKTDQTPLMKADVPPATGTAAPPSATPEPHGAPSPPENPGPEKPGIVQPTLTTDKNSAPDQHVAHETTDPAPTRQRHGGATPS